MQIQVGMSNMRAYQFLNSDHNRIFQPSTAKSKTRKFLVSHLTVLEVKFVLTLGNPCVIINAIEETIYRRENRGNGLLFIRCFPFLAVHPGKPK
jgi:hypothetical protein